MIVIKVQFEAVLLFIVAKNNRRWWSRCSCGDSDPNDTRDIITITIIVTIGLEGEGIIGEERANNIIGILVDSEAITERTVVIVDYTWYN